jgi:hypothetical protein
MVRNITNRVVEAVSSALMIMKSKLNFSSGSCVGVEGVKLVLRFQCDFI